MVISFDTGSGKRNINEFEQDRRKFKNHNKLYIVS